MATLHVRDRGRIVEGGRWNGGIARLTRIPGSDTIEIGQPINQSTNRRTDRVPAGRRDECDGAQRSQWDVSMGK